MPDSPDVGNLTRDLLTNFLGAGSLTVWTVVAVRWWKGRELLTLAPRVRIPGDHSAAPWAFALAFLLPLLMAGVLPVSRVPSVLRVQQECLRMLLQLLVLGGMVASTGGSWARPEGAARPGFWYRVLAGCAAFLASLAPVMIVQYFVVEKLGLREDEGKHIFFKILEADPGIGTALWIAVAVVVLAPLTEELMYRVVLQGWAEGRATPRDSILLVAAMFAAVHYDRGRPDFLPLFPLALILGYLYYRLHSYLAVVVMHALFNATNLAMALLKPPG